MCLSALIAKLNVRKLSGPDFSAGQDTRAEGAWSVGYNVNLNKMII